jgi:hypothetical protein
MDRWQGMADDPDTMRARLDRLTELVELARQVPWEDHGFSHKNCSAPGFGGVSPVITNASRSWRVYSGR